MFTYKVDEGPLFTFLNCYTHVQSGYFPQRDVDDVNHVHRAYSFDIRRIRRVNRADGSHYFRVRCPHPIRFRTDWVHVLFSGPDSDEPVDIMNFFSGSPAPNEAPALNEAPAPREATADLSAALDDLAEALKHSTVE